MDIRKKQGQYFGLQQEMFDFWTDMFADILQPEKSIGEAAKSTDQANSNGLFNSSVKSYLDFTNRWMELGNQMLSKSLNPLDVKEAQGAWEKIFSGAELYQQLYTIWQKLTHQLPLNPANQAAQFCKEWQNLYYELFVKNFVPHLPQQMQFMFTEPADLFRIYSGLTMNVFQPWLDNSETYRELTAKNPFGDKNSSLELIKLWNQNYEATFSKLFNAPALGMYRQELEKQMQSFDAFMKYANALNEFYGAIFKIGMEATENIVQDYRGMAGDPNQPKTFREFYQYWWTRNEDAYHNLFKTKEFSELLGQVSEASFEFKKSLDQFLEQQLKLLPIPTKTEMDSLYKTVYEMKKQVRAMVKQLSALENKINPIEQ